MSEQYFLILRVLRDDVKGDMCDTADLKVEIESKLYDYLLHKVARLTIAAGGTVIADEI